MELDEDEVNLEIARAFQIWADVADLTFEQKFDSDADIEIRYDTVNNFTLKYQAYSCVLFKRIL